MAVTTIHSHVNRAKEFSTKTDIYFAIGKPTNWVDEENPPTEDFTATSLDTVIGYKKVENICLVRPALHGETPDIPYREENWMIVPPDQAMEQGARWVYIDTNLLYTELPLSKYRQVGVYVGLQKAEGVDPQKYALLPEEVANSGVLEVIDNRKASNRQIDQREKLSLILEF